MTSDFLSHNPFLVITELLIDGQPLLPGSAMSEKITRP